MPLILLDLDGTLADPGEGITHCITHALREMAVASPPAKALQRFIGPPLEEAFSELLPDPTPAHVARAIAHYRARFEEVGPATAIAYPGVGTLLAALEDRNWPALVVTFKSPDHALSILDRLDFRRYVAGVYGAEPTRHPSKAELVDQALAARGVAAADTVMVGDRHHDVLGAHANGAAAIGVGWGYGSHDELTRAGADWVCDTTDEVLDRLDAWLSGPLPTTRANLIAMRRINRARPQRIEPTGPNQQSCWEFPRPPRLVPAEAVLRVVHEGATLAESAHAWQVQETAGPPTYYFPVEAVDRHRLEPSDDDSLCEWKGRAQHWRMRGSSKSQVVAWSYPEPLPGYERLRNHLAFFASRLDACYVGEERALPQLGNYYGGWITRAVTGPFKGLPGTEDW